jgi:hypothetical protein
MEDTMSTMELRDPLVWKVPRWLRTPFGKISAATAGILVVASLSGAIGTLWNNMGAPEVHC